MPPTGRRAGQRRQRLGEQQDARVVAVRVGTGGGAGRAELGRLRRPAGDDDGGAQGPGGGGVWVAAVLVGTGGDGGVGVGEQPRAGGEGPRVRAAVVHRGRRGRTCGCRIRVEGRDGWMRLVARISNTGSYVGEKLQKDA